MILLKKKDHCYVPEWRDNPILGPPPHEIHEYVANSSSLTLPSFFPPEEAMLILRMDPYCFIWFGALQSTFLKH